jgi:DIS3-like exonuclease 1
VNFLLRSLATTAMVQAVYFSTGSIKQEEWNHYGLALDKYTHFTSPIRRYADVLVHRLLLAAVSLSMSDWWGGGEVQDKATTDLLPNTELQDLCTHINARNRAAQHAQRDSQVLFQTLYFKDRALSDPRCVVDAVIFSLRENGFLVYIPQYAIKGPVYLESREKEVLYCGRLGPTWQMGVVTKKEMFVKVETIEGTNMYRRFDHVTVGIQLKGSEAHPHVLSLTLLDNKPWKGEGDTEDKTVNFLREAKLDQKEDREDSDEEMVEEVGGSKRKKPKVNVYEFFEEMRKIGVRPLNSE